MKNFFTLNFDTGAADRLPKFIYRPANVSPTVLRITIVNVQRNKTKIVRGFDSIAFSQRMIVVIPFDSSKKNPQFFCKFRKPQKKPQFRIIRWNNSTFQMRRLTFLNSAN